MRVTSRLLMPSRVRRARAARSIGAQRGATAARHAPQAATVVLVGGMTGSGKSWLANAMARELGRTRVLSTDLVRALVRTSAGEAAPLLHVSSFEGHETDQRVAVRARHRLLAAFEAQARALEPALDVLIERSLLEREPLILEGVHVTPAYVARARAAHAGEVAGIVVGVRSREAHRQQFLARGAASHGRRPAERYLARFAAIRALHDHVVREAYRLGVPVIPSDDAAIPLALGVIGASGRATTLNSASDAEQY